MQSNLRSQKDKIKIFLEDQGEHPEIKNIDDINKIVAGVVAHNLTRHGDRERYLLHNIN
jgi:hypothetical protein